MMTTAEYAYKAGMRSKSLVASVVLLSRPGILALVLLAGFAGMVMAAGGLPDAGISVLTLFCLLLPAAGSAMINSVLDYPLDVKMVRLQARVEAMTDLGRNRTICFAICSVIVPIVIAFCYLNTLVALLILSAVLTYAVPYTLWFKRRSPFGVVPGGIPGALPVLVGYAAVADAIRPEALILFIILLLWQPPHFWILALKHRDDYLNSGLPVLPAVAGSACTNSFILLYASALLPASLALGFFATVSIWYQAVAALSGILFITACYLYVIRGPFFGRAFRVSICYLLFLLLAIIIDISLAGTG